MSMTLSDAGLKFIETFEGLRLKAYLDLGGVPTIGFGHTGPEVQLDMLITFDQAESYLISDIQKAVNCVNDAVKMPIAQNEFDALVSFTYNVGCGALKNSTLLKNLNGGNAFDAATEFLRWNKVNGRPTNGLTNRRKAERILFLGE
jgi:lysozyme